MTSNLKTALLTPDEQAAATEFMESVDKAPLKSGSHSEVDLEGLDQVLDKFVAHFQPWAKLDNRGSKLTALRIDRPTTLAVPNKVVLIPFAINPNNSTIAKQTIKIGSYVFLTKNVVLEPGIRCLAFLAE